jgi:hypothetical protein
MPTATRTSSTPHVVGAGQSRVAKMETADPSVSMDLLVRAHLALGATPKDLARAIGKASKAA